MITTAYANVEGMVYKIVHRFRQIHGGDFEELMSDAGLAYAAAHNRYDPAVAKYTTWIWTKVWYGLLSARRRRAKLHARFPTERTRLDGLLAKTAKPLQSLLAEASDDAKAIVSLCLEAPKGDAVGIRKRIARFLFELGWSGRRIVEGFREIKDAMAL